MGGLDLDPGVSIRNGPVIEDVLPPDSHTNGTTKRKSISSTATHQDESGSDSDDAPLVSDGSIGRPCSDISPR
jgi:hypothetical protein